MRAALIGCVCALAACVVERVPSAPEASSAGDADAGEPTDGDDTRSERDLGSDADRVDSVDANVVARSRPFLHLGAGDVPASIARARRGDEQSSTLWDRVEALARSEVPAWPEVDPWEGPTAVVRARIAECAALVGLVARDPAASTVALDVLAAPAPDPTPLGEGLLPTSDWNLWESEALVASCHAYDLVAGTPGLDPERVAAAEIQLAARVATFERLVLEPSAFRTFLLFARNNHVLKALGALGTCGLALPDRPGAARAVTEAVTGLAHVLLEVQASPDGGYAEGWGYFVYGAATWLPLVSAWARVVAEGGPRALVAEGVLTPTDPLIGAAREVGDLGMHPTMRALFRAAIQSARPDGLLLPIDDGDPAPLLGTLAGALSDEPALAWAAASTGWPSAPLEALSWIAAARAPTAEAPAWPLDEVLPDAGLGILRSDRGPGATLVVLLAEHGPMRVHGLGHEHADPLSLILHAHGEPLLIDPGYIDHAHHERVRHATDHNVVLVDGRGPGFPFGGAAPEGDAWLGPLEVTGQGGAPPRASSLTGVARYGGMEIRRRVVRPDAGGYVVVADHARAEDGAAHTLALVWNGLGGGDVPDGSFTPTPHGAVWERPRAAALVVVAPTHGPAAATSRVEEHAIAHGAFAWHVALDVAVAAPTRDGGFLTILWPARAGDPRPSFVVERPAPGVALVTLNVGAAPVRWALVTGAAPVELALEGAPLSLDPGLHALDAGLAWPTPPTPDGY